MSSHRRVLLMNPPTGLYRRDDRCQNQVAEQTVQVVLPPIELAYMAAFLRREGVECEIRDYPAEGRSWADFRQDLLRGRFDMVVLRVTAPTLSKDLEVCRLAKEVLPGVLTVGVSAIFEEHDVRLLADHPELDIAVRGEPERPVLEIALGKALSKVRGIAYRDKKGVVVRTAYERKEADFRDYPHPARELLRNELYLSPDTREPITTIQTSRGCPYECVFCPAGSVSDRRVKFREVSDVVDEIEECVVLHNIRYFLFGADTFTVNKRWVMGLCDEIERRKLDISWAANSRADTIDREMLLRMMATGCRVLGFGVESGDDEMLRLMKKDITVAELRRGIALAKEVGLRTHTFYVLGLPWETRETLARTAQFARELDADFFDFNIAFPLPNTEYERIVREERLAQGSIEGLGYGSSPVRTRELSHEELVSARRRLLLSLYLRPSYIWRTLRREATSAGQLLHFVSYGLRRIRQIALNA